MEIKEYLTQLAEQFAAWCEQHITAESADQISNFYDKESAQ